MKIQDLLETKQEKQMQKAIGLEPRMMQINLFGELKINQLMV
jgi:hypothetical protein